MTPEGIRVLTAVAWTERMYAGPALPLKRIAMAALGGNGDLASRVLADLDHEGCVHTDTMGWQSGWLTDKGRAVVGYIEGNG